MPLSLPPFLAGGCSSQLVRFLDAGTDTRAVVEVDGVIAIQLRRYWWAPLTWLLPSRVPVHGTATLTVKGWNDKVARIRTR